MYTLRKIDLIVIHCAATKPSMNVGAKEINIWHRQRGFYNPATGLSIGYHFVIRRDGTVETGRPIDQPGAHAKGYNANSIGICLIGGLNQDTGKPEANYTEKQREALLALVVSLCKEYGVKKIVGHNQLAVKDCPCFLVPEWLDANSATFKEGGIEIEY